MTTEARGGLPRRSFLAAATAVVATSVMAGGLVFADAPGAAAATGANVTWRISSEPSDARGGYVGMLNAIRQAVRGGRLDSLGGPPVDVTDINGTNQYITVDLHTEGQLSFIRLFLRRSDSYLMGWRWGTEDADDRTIVYWPSASTRSFFTLDAAVAPTLSDGTDNPARLPGSTVANTNTRFETLATYGNLQQQGATRDGMQISPANFDTAVTRLLNGENVETRLAAASILLLIVGVAEASRFREQARETAVAFGRGVSFALSATHIAFHNNWSRLSRGFLVAVIAGTAVFATPVEVAGIVIGTTVAAAAYLMTAYHSDLDTKGKHFLEGSLLYVSQDGLGDQGTVQAAIDALPDSGSNSILIDKGTYNEVISVPSSRPWLTIRGVSGSPGDVVISYERAHGTLKPDGTQWGTQGSAVATFKAHDLFVQDLTIQNTFDPAKHPEINAFETQAVALAAMGDRQVFGNVRLIGIQDTVLAKAPVATTQTRQYIYNSYIEGSIDFVFGNATAVIDRCQIAVKNWVGGTILAPNTDKSIKYGILIVSSTISTDGVPAKTMYLGRPWHNTTDTWPQAVVRDSAVHAGIDTDQPWTDMTPDYSWSSARFKEYNNDGPGAGFGANAPQLTDSEAADYTAEKYLAGSDGWNPVW
ncbi:pectinesterase family protein [Streptomyces sp. NPDC087850]|uniref:pectinesterase family protein n=1 Tax=Streptomyces sp. NPDC087850 TaxID=3365809 RepID=UPI0037FA742B